MKKICARRQFRVIYAALVGLTETSRHPTDAYVAALQNEKNPNAYERMCKKTATRALDAVQRVNTCWKRRLFWRKFQSRCDYLPGHVYTARASIFVPSLRLFRARARVHAGPADREYVTKLIFQMVLAIWGHARPSKRNKEAIITAPRPRRATDMVT